MNLCPKYIHLRDAQYHKDNTIKNKEDNYPGTFDLIEDKKIGCLKKIRANTPNKVSIRVFACQNVKGQAKNYCDTRIYDPEAELKICEPMETEYVFFYVDESENEERPPKPIVYFLIFTRSTSDEEMEKIATEVEITAKKLEITNNIIHCYLFLLSKYPQCDTMNEGAIKERFNNHCTGKNYICLPKFLIQFPNQWLYVNEGYKKFTFKTQPQE